MPRKIDPSYLETLGEKALWTQPAKRGKVKEAVPSARSKKGYRVVTRTRYLCRICEEREDMIGGLCFECADMFEESMAADEE